MRGVLAGSLLGAVCGVLGAALVDCASQLPAAEQVTVTESRSLTDREDRRCECRREAREAGHASVYDRCMGDTQ